MRYSEINKLNENKILVDALPLDKGFEVMKSHFNKVRYDNQVGTISRVKNVDFKTVTVVERPFSWSATYQPVIEYKGLWTGNPEKAPVGSEVRIRYTPGAQGGSWQYKLNGSAWQYNLNRLAY